MDTEERPVSSQTEATKTTEKDYHPEKNGPFSEQQPPVKHKDSSKDGGLGSKDPSPANFS